MSVSSFSIAVADGVFRADPSALPTETVLPGLKLGLVMSGRFGLTVDGGRDLDIAGPAICLLVAERAFETRHGMTAQDGVRYVTIALDPASRDDLLGSDAERLGAGSIAPGIHQARAGRTACALALQIATCPFSGGAGRAWRAAKGLELVATVAAGFLETDGRGARLTSRDLERLREAYHILKTAPADAPTLPVLARRVGMNVRKLTDGFRRQFGTSIADFVAEERLQLAYRLISTGEMGVAEAAYRVGYSPNHLSTAFRRRFGISPGRLR
ncbi:AraC family transcriptional regulator [Tistrella mobilis]|uniref:helix-turn-helix transcriptional regulator n=1 Tax=Tistrella mobilis TaxID=171437 RepID=UPI003557FC30